MEEALDRPEEPEEVFCTFAMARMLAEALPHVNACRIVSDCVSGLCGRIVGIGVPQLVSRVPCLIALTEGEQR